MIFGALLALLITGCIPQRVSSHDVNRDWPRSVLSVTNFWLTGNKLTIECDRKVATFDISPLIEDQRGLRPEALKSHKFNTVKYSDFKNRYTALNEEQISLKNEHPIKYIQRNVSNGYGSPETIKYGPKEQVIVPSGEERIIFPGSPIVDYHNLGGEPYQYFILQEPPWPNGNSYLTFFIEKKIYARKEIKFIPVWLGGMGGVH